MLIDRRLCGGSPNKFPALIAAVFPRKPRASKLSVHSINFDDAFCRARVKEMQAATQVRKRRYLLRRRITKRRLRARHGVNGTQEGADIPLLSWRET